jgi:hypothetical protein
VLLIKTPEKGTDASTPAVVGPTDPQSVAIDGPLASSYHTAKVGIAGTADRDYNPES